MNIFWSKTVENGHKMSHYKKIKLKIKKISYLYAYLWNICDFKLKFDFFKKIITFELRKIETSSLLHFQDQTLNFLKM